jgi:Xaa-Pro aminopeptidase
MDELALRRKRLFSGAGFSSALFHNGDVTHGHSANFAYYSGCEVDGSYLVIRRNGGIVLTNEMNLKQARALSPYPVKLLSREKAVPLLKKECGRGKIGVCTPELNAARYNALRGKVGLKLVDASELFGRVRGNKSEEEIRKISRAARVARGMLESLDPWECGTEIGLANKLKIMALEAGCTVSFEPIVATGVNCSFPHHNPGKAKLGNAALVDFGLNIDGYCSDLSRCYFKAGAKKEKEAYGKCQQVFQEILDALPSMAKASEIAEFSIKAMARHGLPKLPHSIGHGIGLEVHEYPHLGKKSDDTLEGAALAIEPAAYFARYGVRFEETIVPSNSGKRWKIA